MIVVDWHNQEQGRNGAGRLGRSDIDDQSSYEWVAPADSYCEEKLALLQGIGIN